MNGGAQSGSVAVRWRSGRRARGRLRLGGLVLAAAACLALAGAMQPLRAARADALASIAQSDAALSRLAALPEARDRQDDGAAGMPVTAVVTSTASAHGLTIRRIEPERTGARLSIENADFTAVVIWIAELEIENGLRVVALGMDRSADPGVVNVTLTVRR